MPGSPKKRAKREAAEREKLLAAARTVSDSPSPDSLSEGAPTGGSLNQPAPAVTPLQGEILAPAGAPEPTRTALKRAMRARAQEHAEAAIAVLVANMQNPQLPADKRGAAANSLLEWGFGKPSSDIEIGNGDQVIVIRRFGEENT